MSFTLRLFWEAAGGNVPEHWEFKTIDELLEHPKAISVGVMYPGSDTDGGVPLIKVSDVKNGAIASRPSFCISNKVDEEYKRTRLNGSELLLTLVGNPGDCVIVTDEMCGWNVARALAVIRLKDTQLRSWIRYVLASKPAQHLIEARLNTTVQKTLNLKDVREIGIPIPPREERDSITKIIDSIEKKTLLNTQINQTLESIAQAIFKSWFIDFDPVRAKTTAKREGKDTELAAMCAISGKSEVELQQMAEDDLAELRATASLFPDELVESELGEVPKGWEVGKLQEVIDFNPRRTLKKDSLAPYLDMKNVRTQGHLVDEVILRNMTSGTKFINGDTLLARITPCLENGKTAYVDFLLDNEVGWGSTEFIVLRPKEHLPTALGYFIARQENFRTLAIQSMTGTSGRQRANADTLANQSWLIYPADLMIVFDKYAGKYLTHIKNNGLQNGILKNIRDALLPKLLSGELDATLLKK
ncbi:MAG TPA: restriction endonuclease subunit S [Acinetobacter towneri]|nr:restriction endonuclease subunit S [Acinetobacter towneri]